MALQFSDLRAASVGQLPSLMFMLGVASAVSAPKHAVPSIRDPKQILSGLAVFFVTILLIIILAIFVAALAVQALKGF